MALVWKRKAAFTYCLGFWLHEPFTVQGLAYLCAYGGDAWWINLAYDILFLLCVNKYMPPICNLLVKTLHHHHELPPLWSNLLVTKCHPCSLPPLSSVVPAAARSPHHDLTPHSARPPRHTCPLIRNSNFQTGFNTFKIRFAFNPQFGQAWIQFARRRLQQQYDKEVQWRLLSCSPGSSRSRQAGAKTTHWLKRPHCRQLQQAATKPEHSPSCREEQPEKIQFILHRFGCQQCHLPLYILFEILCFIDSFIHSFIHSFIRSFGQSCIRSYLRSLSRCFITYLCVR